MLNLKSQLKMAFNDNLVTLDDDAISQAVITILPKTTAKKQQVSSCGQLGSRING